jgi:drug/metabolite transporter (DMT)-like permease
MAFRQNIQTSLPYFYLLFGLFFQTANKFIHKYMISKDVHPFTITAYRGMIYCSISIIFISFEFNKKDNKFDPKRIHQLLFRGLLNGAGIMGGIFSISLIRLSTLELLLRTGNIMTLFMGYLFLNEQISKYDIFGFMSTLLGVILIIRPSIFFGRSNEEDLDKPLGIIIVLGMTFIVAVGQVTSKSLLKRFNEIYLIFAMGLLNLLMAIIGANIFNVPLYQPWSLLPFNILTSCMEYTGTYFCFKALSIESIAKLSPFYNAKIIYSVVLTYFIYNDITFLDVLGTGIIISTYAYLSYKKFEN